MKDSIARSWTMPIVLLGLAFLSYGLLLPWLGFYWDDWPSIWFLRFLGPKGFVRVFAEDRPLLGGLFWLTTSIWGESALLWQVFGLLMRWGSSLALWWFLRLLWPHHSHQADWVAILFTLYPGFSQQFIAVTYSHVFLVLTLFLFSLGSMIQAVRRTDHLRWLWYLASGLSAVYSLFAVEYFFGLELLRPVILGLALPREGDLKTRVKRILKVWLPYLVGLAAFLLWRIALHPSPRGQVQIFEEVGLAPAKSLLDLLVTIFEDILQAGLLAWLQVVDPFKLRGFGLLTSLLYGGVVLATAGLASIWLVRRYAAALAAQGWLRQALPLGLLALLFAGWPFWSTDLPVELRFPWDRFTLAFTLGSSLLVAGLIALIPRRLPRLLIFGGLIGLAVGQHFYIANQYRREWQMQKNFFWQLTWRAPHIESGTLLVTSELPFVHFSDNSLTAPLNWTYSPYALPQPMPYMIYDLEARLGEALPDLRAGQPIDQDYRAAHFMGNTSQALAFYYQPPGCVKILDPANDADLPQKPKYMSEALRLSRPGLIKAGAGSAAQPPQAIFGPEPRPDWCYFFEKAELARQVEDWPRVASLADQALSLEQRLYPVNAPEFLPYIEAYAHLERWDDAVQLSLQAYRLNRRMERSLCATWERLLLQTVSGAQRQSAVDDLAQILPCLKS